MEKYFNTTGLCVPELHYMVNIDNKINQIEKLINRGNYFSINKPRQFGKTTTLNEIERKLSKDYLIVSLSFEGLGDIIFSDERDFSKKFVELIVESLELQDIAYRETLKFNIDNVNNISDLSKEISKFVKAMDKEVILIIDEVDKSSNNQLFLSFLGMLRNKYLLRVSKKDVTFKSIILAGVHDVKSLKLKLRGNDEAKYNSPWNIAVNFKVDMSFNVEEIETMLIEYCSENDLEMETKLLVEKLYYYTSGYPFLVSGLCQIIDENIYEDNKTSWILEDIDKAVKIITNEDNTLFQSIVKNLENNQELYDLVKRILVNGEIITFNILDPIINLGVTYGIFSDSSNGLTISNKIFEEVLYNYMLSKLRTKTKDMSNYNFKSNFITENNGLNIEKILKRFQQYMKENYSSIDQAFIEREGRLIFLAFITPIINGIGFALKEVQISEEKRLDIVITYNSFKYILELKLWRGESYHEKGIKQLDDYLNIHDMDMGYLVIFNFNKGKEYKEETIDINNKKIFSIYV